MRIVVAGGTGFIGTPLVEALRADSHDVVVLSRSSQPEDDESRIQWDGRTIGGWRRAIDGAGAVINLAGANIGSHRWSAKRKYEILHSRIDATKALVQAIAGTTQRPCAFICASAVGYYGNVPDNDVTENSHAGHGFLADVCRAWEREADAARHCGVRVVMARLGIVLERDGGALGRMLPIFRFGAGGRLGNGCQWMPWIHRVDAIRAIQFFLENEDTAGPYNLTAPEPVTNREFTRSLAKALHRPAFLHMPASALRLVMGEMADMVLTGQRAIPQKLIDAGFAFSCPALTTALDVIVHGDSDHADH